MTRSYDGTTELPDEDIVSGFDNFIEGLVADLDVDPQDLNYYGAAEKVKGNIGKFRSVIEKKEKQYKLDYQTLKQLLLERDKIFGEKAKQFESSRKKMWDDYEKEMTALKADRERFTADYQNALQENSSSFVQTTVEELRIREKYLSKKSNNWANLGAAILTLGLLVVILLSFWASSANHNDMSWPSLLFYSFKGVIILTVVGFFTRYSFVMSGNFMQESLKTDNRMHAIKFGQFYIKTYGATANWEQVKEVFSSWNGDGKTSWKNNIQYDELNNAIATISKFANKTESDKMAAKAPGTKSED